MLIGQPCLLQIDAFCLEDQEDAKYQNLGSFRDSGSYIGVKSWHNVYRGNREAPGAEEISKFLNTAIDRRPMAP